MILATFYLLFTFYFLPHKLYFKVTRRVYFISLDSLLFIAQNHCFNVNFTLTITSLATAERLAI